MRTWISSCISLLLLLGTALSQDANPLDLQDIEKTIGGFSAGIAEKVDQNPAVPSFEDFENALKEKCDKNAGPGAFDRLDAVRDELQECIQSNLDFEVIQKELAAARKTGSMDEVFSKYCSKTPIIKQCVYNASEAIEACLNKEEKESLAVILNVTDSLTEFLCFKDGDRIAMFIAEGGIECVREQSDGITACLNKTVGASSTLSNNSLPALVFTDQQCDNYDKLQTCVVTVLENCKDTTPANIVEALFKYVRRITPCPQKSSRRRFIRNSPNTTGLEAIGAAFEEIAQKYEPHCVKNGGQKALTELRETLANVRTCQETQFNNLKAKRNEINSLPYVYVCKDFRDGLHACLKGLVKKIEACSPKLEKYVSDFSLQVYDSVFDFSCKDDARMLKKYFDENDICTKKIVSATGSCFDKTKHIRSVNSDAVVTKTELCEDLKSLKSCYLEGFTRECPNNNNVKDYVTGFTDAIHAPCASCRILIASFLLVVCLIFVKMF